MLQPCSPYTRLKFLSTSHHACWHSYQTLSHAAALLIINLIIRFAAAAAAHGPPLPE